ncbi:sigma-70 family RNA polymerase sigma factor [Sandaracinus amylolyticus]|uniref:sigma-70 family RNA polymerase sigma factor n=1 Tax=Sandaracinus amylolyticus TaxID=927083 RepID=UPI001F00A25F|nr:sigma-70 family RNA polymerase sigma factor [Sandaracinus amylolyticus]UJR80999.1 ECF RNA polymerase sigma factor SigJ [Sandaracinus amylolyticus]
MSDEVDDDLVAWRARRPRLVALAYRMLGDLGRAEDLVQDAWLRWRHRTERDVPADRYLVTIVTRLCLNELTSARARREESRGDRLPEPIDLAANGLETIEAQETLSMAFLVVVARLTPSERAVLILHDVLGFSHEEIAGIVDKSVPACRKLLERARSNLRTARREREASREEHARLLDAFARAARLGDVDALVALLRDDAVMITDGGAAGRRGPGIRNLVVPLHGAANVARFVVVATKRGPSGLTMASRELNGAPALVIEHEGAPYAVLAVHVEDGRIAAVYFHADAARLGHVRRRSPVSGT